MKLSRKIGGVFIVLVMILQSLLFSFSGVAGLAHVSQADGKVVYEAEDYLSNGTLIDSYGGISFSNKAYLVDHNQYCEFTIDIPVNGFYRAEFSMYGYFQGTIAFDESKSTTLYIVHEEKKEYSISDRIYIPAGTHKCRFECDEKGYCAIDFLTIEFLEEFDFESCYNTDYQLSNSNASKNAKELFSFIQSNYGKNVISGQYTATGYSDSDFQRIKEKTGQLPAIMGLELMEYSSALGPYQTDTAIDYAIEYAGMGGIVNFQWHWIAPIELLLKDDNGRPKDLLRGFRTQYVEKDALANAMSDETSAGYNAIMSDLDALAEKLKRLADADIPILFRPLHEASGGWFWWGACGKEPYIKLWQKMYDKFTNEYHLNNLIWVWNGQNRDWYPGDEYVDIVGEDIYPDAKDYSPHSAKFTEVVGYSDAIKVAALTECGVLFDIDEAIQNNTIWSWFLSWNWIHTIPKSEDEQFATDANGNLINNPDGGYYEIQTELSMWNKVYNHSRVLTLGDLPFHSHIDDDADKVCDICNHDIAPEKDNKTLIISLIITAVVVVVVAIFVTIIVFNRRKKLKK